MPVFVTQLVEYFVLYTIEWCVTCGLVQRRDVYRVLPNDNYISRQDKQDSFVTWRSLAEEMVTEGGDALIFNKVCVSYTFGLPFCPNEKFWSHRSKSFLFYNAFYPRFSAMNYL